LAAREDRNAAFHAAFDEPWEGAGAAKLRSATERGTPLMNMQMQPRHGMTGATVHKTVGAMLEASGQSHTVGAGLATGRVGHVLRDTPQNVRPSMRALMLSDNPETYREHDVSPGMKMADHPEHIEDMEVRQAGLPPLRSTSRAGFMPGLGSVAMHKQEARAHEARLAPELDTLNDLTMQHKLASRRKSSALARGDKVAAKEHGAAVKDLAGQIRTHQNEVVAPIQKLVTQHHKAADDIVAKKVGAINLVKGASKMPETEAFTAQGLEAHKQYFDPTVKEEFYPEASQHQLGMVGEGAGVSKTEATNVTAMASAQRRWRNKDADSGVVTHPNLILAETFAAHHQALQSSGKLAEVEHAARQTAEKDILAMREKSSAHQHDLALAAGRESYGPKPIKTEVTPAHIEQHVADTVAQHVASTYKAPAPLMGLAETHGRDMARLLSAKTPEEMSDVWAKTDSDKRPTFALALAAKHPNRSVRRQSAQAMTVDTHRAKELELDYNEVLGTGPGMHSTAKQEIPHQPGRQVQPAYNAMAMMGSRAALQMTAKNFKPGVGGEAVTPRYAQENPWGLFAAENMGDVAKARAVKKAGGSRTIRGSAAGYYTEQAKEAVSRTEEFHRANPEVRRRKFSDEGLLEDMF
jgi:hypothetical protein